MILPSVYQLGKFFERFRKQIFQAPIFLNKLWKLAKTLLALLKWFSVRIGVVDVAAQENGDGPVMPSERRDSIAQQPILVSKEDSDLTPKTLAVLEQENVPIQTDARSAETLPSPPSMVQASSSPAPPAPVLPTCISKIPPPPPFPHKINAMPPPPPPFPFKLPSAGPPGAPPLPPSLTPPAITRSLFKKLPALPDYCQLRSIHWEALGSVDGTIWSRIDFDSDYPEAQLDKVLTAYKITPKQPKAAAKQGEKNRLRVLSLKDARNFEIVLKKHRQQAGDLTDGVFSEKTPLVLLLSIQQILASYIDEELARLRLEEDLLPCEAYLKKFITIPDYRVLTTRLIEELQCRHINDHVTPQIECMLDVVNGALESRQLVRLLGGLLFLGVYVNQTGPRRATAALKLTSIPTLLSLKRYLRISFHEESWVFGLKEACRLTMKQIECTVASLKLAGYEQTKAKFKELEAKSGDLCRYFGVEERPEHTEHILSLLLDLTK